MHALFKKLNYKAQKQLYVLNAPESFEENSGGFPEEATVLNEIPQAAEVTFALVFVTRQAEIDILIPQIAPRLHGDALLWMCYPKTTSKKYRCDFNRDSGWHLLGQYGLEPVRMVAIDEDWSALRFRKVDYIKKMTRQSALSEAGKVKSGQTRQS